MPAKRKKTVKFPPLPPILSDEDCVESRRRAALEAQAPVRVVRREEDGVRGLYAVESGQRAGGYEVEFRDPAGTGNTCNCPDFRMNRLGTCKHVERVRQVAEARGKRAFARAAAAAPLRDQVWVDACGEEPRLAWRLSAEPLSQLQKLLQTLRESETSLFVSMQSLRSLVERLRPEQQKRVWISDQSAFWEERERMRISLEAHRSLWEAEGEVPPSLRVPLYPYQREGMTFLAFRGRALLADEMGLGKTVQAIAAAELLRMLGVVERVLVVCPTSLKAEWEEQLAFFTGRQARLLYGGRAARLLQYPNSGPWLICNYEQVIRDVDDINSLHRPDLVILDEAQRIKNWPTKTAKAVKRLASPFAFVLTGTPIENRIEELYSLCEFIDPRVLGHLERFQREFSAWDAEEKRFYPRNLTELHHRLKPILLRRRKAEIETELPPRSDKTYFVGMTPEQKLRYDEVSEAVGRLLAALKRRRLTQQELERLQLLLAQMRMLCDTPYILDPSCRDCPKLEELDAILEEVLAEPDAKVIVFSEWVRMLELVMERLEAKGIGYVEHHGGVRQEQRRENIRRFKTEAECRVFLSSESGGVGLNLQAANVVINLDLPWNPAKLEQRIARAWRKRQMRSVRVIHLVTSASLEEAMIGKLAAKTALAEAVVDGVEHGSDFRGGSDFLRRMVEIFADAGKREAPRPKTMAERLRSRHGDVLLGMLEAPEGGARIAVARDEQAVAALRRTVSEMENTDAPPMVISEETLLLLRQLRDAGVISFRAPLETREAVPGFDPGPLGPPSPPRRFPQEAREHWRKAEEARTAAGALLGVGLSDLARPHLDAARINARECLWLLYTGQPPPPGASGADLPVGCGETSCPDADNAGEVLAWIGQAGSRIAES